MEQEKNTAVSVDQEREGDDLTAINDIGPAFSDALNKIGIRRFADLAQWRPNELSQALIGQAGVKVPSERIAAKAWIDQAKVLAQQANTRHTSPKETTEAVQKPQKPSPKEEWEQYAGFNLFFDFKTDEHGEQEWLTRVYYFTEPHDDFDAKEEFLGIKTTPWVNWILTHAKLPAAAEPIPTETEVAALPVPVTPPDAKIKILDVQVSRFPTPDGVREKKLVAEVRFQISGPKAERMAVERIPYQFELHTVNLENQTSNLITCERSQLKPDLFEYTGQQQFPMPDLGRYELQSVVLLLSPGEILAFRSGPIINIIP